MKKIQLLAALAATVVSACGGSSSDSALHFGTVKVQKQVSITNEDGAPTCNVHLELDTVDWKQGEAAKAMNAAIAQELLGIDTVSLQVAADSFATTYTNDYRQNFAPLYREDRNDETKRAWYEYHYNVIGEAGKGRKGVTVYTATIDYYEGGAHGINQRIVLNFDNETGRLLTLRDVLVPGYEQPLCELLLQKLMEQKGAKTVDELRNSGYLYSMDMFAPENFVLGEDGITFIYNTYEIAAYSEGMTELKFDNDELEELWK